MTPEDQTGMPPGLMDALMGGGMPPEAEPDEIDVELPGDEESAGETDADLLRTAIEALEQAMQNEADDADSAKLAKIVHELYALTSGQQDAAMSALGGKPKDMRALSRAYG